MTEDEVQVPLTGSPDEVVGHDWPSRDDGSRPDATAVEREHTVVITHGDEEVLRTGSQLTFLRERDDRVVQVNATPLEGAVSLDEAIDAAESLLGDHGLLDDRARDDLAGFRDHEDEDDPAWPANRSTLRTTATGTDVEVDVELRPTGETGWFIGLTVVPAR